MPVRFWPWAPMYYVNIKDNETGEIRRCKQTMEWEDHCEWFWTEGNFGCDCNRSITFGADCEAECGESRYSVVNVELGDGTTFTINENQR